MTTITNKNVANIKNLINNLNSENIAKKNVANIKNFINNLKAKSH